MLLRLLHFLKYFIVIGFNDKIAILPIILHLICTKVKTCFYITFFCNLITVNILNENFKRVRILMDSVLFLDSTKCYWAPTSKALWWMSGGSAKGWYAPLTRSNICRNWENRSASSHHETTLIFCLFIPLFLKFSSALAAEEKPLPESLSSCGSSCVLRKWCFSNKQEPVWMCVCYYLLVCTVYALASSVLLFMLRAMTHAPARARRQTRHKL